MEDEFATLSMEEPVYEEEVVDEPVPTKGTFLDKYIVSLQEGREEIAKHKGLQRKIVEDKVIIDLYTKWCEVFGFDRKTITTHLHFEESKVDTSLKTEYTFRELLESGAQAGEYLVPGLMQPGTLTISWGLPKSGKTTFTKSLVKAVLYSGELLGLPVMRGKVAEYQLEQGVSISSMQLIELGLDDGDATILKYTDTYKYFTSFNILEDLNKLEDMIYTYQPRLVVFDSFRMMLAGTGISEYSETATEMMYRLQRVFIKSGFCSGNVLHHQNKGKTGTLSDLAGHNGLAGACDLLINFKKIKADDGTDRVEMRTVPRQGTPRHLIIKQVLSEGGRYHLAIEEEIGIDPEVQKMSNKIIRVLTSLPYSKYTNNQLRDRLGISRNPAYDQALIDLRRMCLVNVERTQDKEFLYSVPEKSAWFNTGSLLSSVSMESRLADSLSRCRTRQDLRILTREWSQETKQNVVALLSQAERDLVVSLSQTCPYNVGDTVLYNALLLEVLETKTESKVFWFRLDGYDEWVSEDDLSYPPVSAVEVETEVEPEINPQDSSLF